MNCPYCQKKIIKFIDNAFDCKNCKTTLMYKNDGLFSVGIFSKDTNKMIIDVLIIISDDRKSCSVMFFEGKSDTTYPSKIMHFDYSVDELNAKKLAEKIFNMKAFI